MRPIDADALKSVVNEDINRCYALGSGSVGPLSHFLDQIDEQPTVGAGEVVHGMWIELAFGELKCSTCGVVQEDDAFPYNYCPSCGAKMDAKEAPV